MEDAAFTLFTRRFEVIMVCKFEIGYALSAIVDCTITSKMREKLKMDPELLKKWEKEDGEIASSIVRELARFLHPTPKVEILDKDTAGDQYFKIDIILEFPEWTQPAEGNIPEQVHPAYTCAFQVKTHKGQADTFIWEYGENGVSYNGQVYPCPGVFYCNSETLGEAITVDNVKVLAEFTHSDIHPEITEAIHLIHTRFIKVAKKEGPYLYIDYRPFQKMFDPWVWDALCRLKVISIGGGRIIIN